MRLRRRALFNGVLFGLAFAVLFWLVVLPLLMIVMVSFRSGSPLDLGPFTLANYGLTYSYSVTYKTLLNSLLYAGISVAIVMSMAVAFAWLIERTDMPCRRLAWALILVPIGMPSFLLAMSWILLLNPRVGLVNILLRSALAIFGVAPESGPINIYSLGGMIFVNSVTGLTTAFLLVVGAFRLINQEIEDAAHVSGASKRITLCKVTLPVLMPALTVATLYKFAGDLNDMDIPLLLGLQNQIFVLPTLIFFSAFYSTPIEWGLATALSSPFIIIAICLSYAYFHFVIKQAERQKYVTITGKAAQTRRIRLGKWRYPAFGLFLVYFLLSTALPLLILLWASLLPSYRPPSWDALTLLTFRKYWEILEWPNFGRVLVNTLALGGGTAILAMSVAFFISWVVVRSRVPGRFFLDAAIFVPHVLPGSLIALGLVFTYLHPAFRWLPFYGTIWIMIAAMLVTYLPFSTRLMNDEWRAYANSQGTRGSGYRQRRPPADGHDEDHAAADPPSIHDGLDLGGVARLSQLDHTAHVEHVRNSDDQRSLVLSLGSQRRFLRRRRARHAADRRSDDRDACVPSIPRRLPQRPNQELRCSADRLAKS
jgi:iron(III) transport system permease protein